MSSSEGPVASNAFGAGVAQANALLTAGVLPPDLEGSEFDFPGTPIYDINGAVLFQRVQLTRSGMPTGYVDLGVDPAIGAPLVAVVPGPGWSGPDLVREGQDVATERFRLGASVSARVVAYSFPKIAVEVTPQSGNPILLEAGTWAEVPAPTGARPGPPGNFEAWSFLDELGEGESAARRERFGSTVEQLADLGAQASAAGIGYLISARWGAVLPPFEEVVTRVLHYSTINTDHSPCYELRGQETNVWCVAASAEMLLDFYRYHYDQTRIASELGLGTLTNPHGLPYSKVGVVVTVLEALSNGSLTAKMLGPGTFADFEDEINANRPLISFIPGHSRSVAGFARTISALASLSFEGLLVYDPWPPDVGVITQWENYAVSTYLETYTSAPTLV